MSDQNTTRETVQWYRDHETTAQIGFNPDGMCLAICRTARNIGPKYASAFSAQHATPLKYRVKKAANIKTGMVGFFDDPNDSNPFGHIVTFVGVLKDHDPAVLDNHVVRTNSVVSGQVVVVRADYFSQHWGDSFQFAATWLNGVEIEDLQPKPVAPTPAKKKRKGTNLLAALKSIEEGIPEMRRAVHANAGNKRLANALGRDLSKMIETRNHLEAVLKKRGVLK